VKAHPADRTEGSIIAKLGEIRTILWSNSALFNQNNGELMMAIAVGHDITERKLAEKALQDSEEKLRAMFESAPDGIAIGDSELNIFQANMAIANIFGLSEADEMIGRNVSEFVAPDALDHLSKTAKKLFETGMLSNIEIMSLKADGTEFPLGISATTIKDVRGEIAGFAAIAKDCTERKAAEVRDKARLQLLKGLRIAKDIDECLELSCKAIFEARLFKRSVLTLHNDKKEITNLGQVGLEPEIIERARNSPAPDEQLSLQLTQDRFRISHSYFIPAESGLLSPDLGRKIEQKENGGQRKNAWQNGDELFIPIVGNGGKYEGWLSVDTPFNGKRPSVETIIALEEVVDIATKRVHEIQSLEKLTRERQILSEINVALNESEERYRGLVETARDVIFTVTQDGIIDSINPAFEQATGWAIDDWLGKRFDSIVYPDDLSKAIEMLKVVFTGQTPPLYELRIKKRNGEYVVGEFLSTPQYRSGKLTKSLGIARDITERKKAEEALEYRLAFESLITGISTSFITLSSDEIKRGIDEAIEKIGEFAGVDKAFVFSISEDYFSLSGTHLWMVPELNQQIALMNNIPISEFSWAIGKLMNFDSVYIPKLNDLPPEAMPEKKILESLYIKSIIIAPMIYGRNLIGGLGFAHLREEKSWDEGIISLLRIIGEIFANAIQRQRTEKELEKINLEKYHQERQIAGGFAHEIRNALFPTRGALSLMREIIAERFENDSLMQYYRKAADDSVTRAIDITALISHYTKLDTDKQPGIVSLNDILREIINANRLRINSQKVHVDVQCPENIKVESNHRQLFIAFNNLLLNSLDALADRSFPFISIKGIRDNGYMIVKLEDNGIGIPKESLGRIFEAFYTTKPDKGTGLGLAMLKRIIDMYDGNVSVWSKPEIGTKFEIKLKLADYGSEDGGKNQI
jgi:PAS domain S-box-containing protein